MQKFWSTRRADLLAGLALILLPALCYPLAALRQGVFYVGDIFRLYYPQRAVYADALRHGSLPLWTPDVLGGFPLLAEGQTGALYPLNLLLYRFLPIDVALNYSILLALSLAGVTTYILSRTLGLRPAPGILAALTFAYGGFSVGHFNHLNIMGALPWLPLELAIVEVALRATQAPLHPKSARQRQDLRAVAPAWVGLSLVVGIQFLAGHPQIWLMSTMVVLAFGLFRAIWPTSGGRRPLAHAVPLFIAVAASVAAGLGVAAGQLLPTWELVRQSVRAGGLSADFFTSFSWHPALLATLVVPFALGNPYPNISVELAAYLGLLPLMFVCAAGILRRDRLTAFLAALGGAALILAFGDYTPLYAPLVRVPVLNLFRVPARFLHPFSLALALLAGLGLDALLARYPEARPGRSAAGRELLFIAAAVIASALGIRALSLDALLMLRWTLPAVTLALAVSLLVLAWQQRVEGHTFAWAAIGLTLADLFAFGAVYRLTYNDLMPVEAFYEEPAAPSFFPEETQTYRTLTHQAIVPALSVMRASLYPNTSLLHGIPSANGYFPLIPARHARYLADLTPGRLNLLNVRYFIIPQLLPVDPGTEQYDLHNPFVPDLVGRTIDIPPTRTDALEIISFTSQSADWPQGAVVAEIVLTGESGSTVTLPVRAGQDTGEWAYDRPDVRENIAHNRPAIAWTWPARSGFPPEDHPGHAYRARYLLDEARAVTSIQVIPKRPAGLIRIAEVALVEGERRHTLAELLGLGQHRLVYRDPDVVIYENQDALPRAFVVHRARVVSDDAAALSIIDSPDFDSRGEVLLAGGPGPALSPPSSGSTARAGAQPTSRATISLYTPKRVMVDAELAQPGYLVLLDSYYPGWRARIDGRPAPIQRADLLFRAVALEPGRHRVTFEYQPRTFRLGSAISLLTLVGLAVAAIALILGRRSSPAALEEAGRSPNI